MSSAINPDELIARGHDALKAGGDEQYKQHQGRVLRVLASAAVGGGLENAALGTSCLPAGFEAPEHTHVSEEVAIFLAGSGGMRIGDDRVVGGVGAIFVVPSDVPHTTWADADEDLVVLWVYCRSGDEMRWLQDER
jgi:quercetin dioxygenase-like cupin family protein